MTQRIRSLGEFGLIERISRRLRNGPTVIVGAGDDCAVLAYTRTHYQLLTCDTIAEGVDFTRRHDPRLIGRKALAVSLSDIAACAGIPRYAVVAMQLPSTLKVAYVDAVMKGMRRLALAFGVAIVGGDISRSSRIAITTTVLGVVEKKRLTLRSGARPGEAIFVTGPLGDSLKGAHLSFTPRVKEARLLTRGYRPGAMIDISDGLTQDLRHILASSGVGAVIYEGCIPRRMPTTSLRQALSGGEDFELLFTLPRDQARRLVCRAPRGWEMIGYITEAKQGMRLCDARGRMLPLMPEGYVHF